MELTPYMMEYDVPHQHGAVNFFCLAESQTVALQMGNLLYPNNPPFSVLKITPGYTIYDLLREYTVRGYLSFCSGSKPGTFIPYLTREEKVDRLLN